MHELRNAHPPEVAIHINVILRGPNEFTATQDNLEFWERHWKSKRVYITVYVYQKQVSDDVAATPFWRNHMTWNARMDGYFSGPITSLCSREARILSKERTWSGCGLTQTAMSCNGEAMNTKHVSDRSAHRSGGWVNFSNPVTNLLWAQTPCNSFSAGKAVSGSCSLSRPPCGLVAQQLASHESAGQQQRGFRCLDIVS